MKLTPAQSQIARDTHRFRVLNCGRRFGKSTLAAWEMLGVACAKKNRRVAYYAPTRDDARDIIWNILLAVAEPAITYKNEQRLEIKVRTQDKGTSSIYLYGWESVQERGKGRGVSNDFIVLDEVASMRNFNEGWDEVLSPTLIDRRGSAMFISTPKGFNHFYDLYNLEGKNPDYKSFHFTSYDNPNLPVEELEREKKSKTEDVFAQEYMADFRKQEGLVYKEFNREIHLFDDFTPRRNNAEVIAGVDFGFTNPSVILKVEHDTDNHYWVTREWYKTGQTNAQIIEVARTMGINTFYPDPAEPDRILEMQNAGLSCREVSKDIEKGIDSVRELFKQGRLHIHKDCVNLIWELETYTYPESSGGKNEYEVPIKENDHAMDALRYCLHNNSPYIENNEEFSLYGSKFS